MLNTPLLRYKGSVAASASLLLAAFMETGSASEAEPSCNEAGLEATPSTTVDTLRHLLTKVLKAPPRALAECVAALHHAAYEEAC